MPRPRSLDRAAAWVGAVAALLASFAALARCPAAIPFNTDNLSPASLYEDTFVTGLDPRLYQHSAATFAVPDMAVYAAVRAVTGSAAAAVTPWYFAQFAVLAAAAAYALRGVVAPATRPWAGPAAVSVAAVYAAATAAFVPHFGADAKQLLIPVNHTGAAGCAFFALGLTARYLTATGRARFLYLVGLAAACGSAAFSDRLFGLYFAVPIAPTLLVLRLARAPGVTVPRAAAVLAAVGVGCGAGLAGIRLLYFPGTATDPIHLYTGPVPKLDDLPGSLQSLIAAAAEEIVRGNVSVIAAAGWLAVAVFEVTVAVRRRKPPPPYAVFGLFAFAAVTGGFTTSSAGVQELALPGYTWPRYSRYFLGPLAVGLFGWAGIAAAGVAAGGVRRVLAVGTPGLALVAVLAVAARSEPPADHRPFRLYPDLARGVDALCIKYGMTDGVAGFWTAKPATLFSQVGAHVHPVEWTGAARFPLQPFVWLTNADGYFHRAGGADGLPHFQFIIADDLQPGDSVTCKLPVAAVVAHFGPPVEAVPVGPNVILVYNRPSDGRLGHLAARGPNFHNLRRMLYPRVPFRYTGAELDGETSQENAGTARVAGPKNTAGLIAAGPHVPALDAGRFYAAFHVTTADSDRPVVRLDVFSDGTGNGAGWRGRLAATELAGGVDGVVRLEFDVPPEMVSQCLEFRAEYFGTGRVRLDGVEFGRVERP